MGRFYLEGKNGHFEASWENILVTEGIGKTPLEAITNLQKELAVVLTNTSKLIEVGRFAVESCLTEMEKWQS